MSIEYVNRRNKAIEKSYKWFAKDAHFKNSADLIEALNGLCDVDGIGGDGLNLWQPAKWAIEGILNKGVAPTISQEPILVCEPPQSPDTTDREV